MTVTGAYHKKITKALRWAALHLLSIKNSMHRWNKVTSIWTMTWRILLSMQATNIGLMSTPTSAVTPYSKS